MLIRYGLLSSSSAHVGTVPVYVSKDIRASGTGNVTPPIPTGLTTNDIMLMVVETANETITVPTGWAHVTNSPQGSGTAGAIGSTAINVLWKRHSGSESAPTVNDAGDHTTAEIFGFRGCPTTGNPWSTVSGGSSTTSNTTLSAAGCTTLVSNELVVICTTTGLDSSSSRWNTANNMAATSVTSLVNVEDISSTSGNGGGIALWTATKASPGSITSVTATANNATEKSWLILGLKPA